MRAYGKKKTHHHVEGHQHCDLCHPENDKNVDRKRRARHEAQQQIDEQLDEVSEEKIARN